MLKQAVILAGGKGIRLRPYTYEKPKLMVEVNGRPFAEYLLDMLKKNGIEEVVFLLGYLPEKVTEYFGDGSKHGLRIKYSVGGLEDGTATRLKNAASLLDEEFLLMYCDNYIDLDLASLLDFHRKHNVPVTMTLYTNKYDLTKNNAFVNSDGFVVKYDKSRKQGGLNAVDLGFFIAGKELLAMIPEENCYMDEKILPALVAENKLGGFLIDQIYQSLSTPERLKRAEHFFSPRMVIFLDRDGVINKKMPKGDYVKKWEEFKFLPEVFEALKLLTENNYEIYLISNQAGIARGKMNEGDLFTIHKNMEQDLAKHGVRINQIYYCPHDWNEGCLCRKPNPGMIFQAAIDHQINLAKAVFVGDDERDGLAGVAAGCPTVLMESDGNLLEVVKKIISGQ